MVQQYYTEIVLWLEARVQSKKGGHVPLVPLFGSAFELRIHNMIRNNSH